MLGGSNSDTHQSKHTQMSVTWNPYIWVWSVQSPDLNDCVNWGSISNRDKIFSSPKCPDWLWGPPSLLFNGYLGFLTLGTVARVKSNYSPPSSAKVKNEWSHSSNPSICLQGILFYPYISQSVYVCTYKDNDENVNSN